MKLPLSHLQHWIVALLATAGLVAGIVLLIGVPLMDLGSATLRMSQRFGVSYSVDSPLLLLLACGVAGYYAWLGVIEDARQRRFDAERQRREPFRPTNADAPSEPDPPDDPNLPPPRNRDLP